MFQMVFIGNVLKRTPYTESYDRRENVRHLPNRTIGKFEMSDTFHVIESDFYVPQ